MRQAKGLEELLSETWEMYRVRGVTIGVVILVTWLVLFGVMMAMGIAVSIMAVAGAGFMAVFQNFDVHNLQPAQLLPLVPIMVVLFIPVFILSLWGNAAMLAVCVDEKLGIGDGLKAGFRYLWPLAWVSLLYMGIVQVGFLFLVIPGIVLSLWFLFSMIIMIEEDRRGLDALLASYFYVKGDTLSVFLKMLALTLFYMVIVITSAHLPIPFSGNLVQLLLLPFMMLFMVVMYRDLRDKKGLADSASLGGGKVIWGSVAAIGLLLPVGILVALVLNGPQLQQFMKEQMQQIEGLEALVQEVEPSDKQTLPTPESGEEVAPASSAEVVELPGGSRSAGLVPNAITVDESETGRTYVPAVEEDETVKGLQAGIWRDPAGDTGQGGQGSLLDIVEVRAGGGEDDILHLSLTLRTPVAQFYAGSSSPGLGRLATIYLDRDLNRETGKKPFGEDARGGYDIVINLMLEATGGSEGRVQVSMSEVAGRGMNFLSPLDPGSITQEGAVIVLRIPYSLIGLKKGHQFRICYQELAQQQGSGLSKDKLVDL